MIKAVQMRLVAASDMPHTLVLGDSPSGLGATGESEQDTWYDHVRNKQESELRPLIRRVMDCILADLNGGKVPRYTIDFNPLWQMNDKDKAEVRLKTAQADQIWYDVGAVGSKEIREGHFAGTSFSPEIVLLEEPDLVSATVEDPEGEGDEPEKAAAAGGE